MEHRAPTGSSRPWLGSFEVGTSSAPATMASTTMGTFTKNTEPHQKCSSMNPLSTGPRAAPAPENPAQMAMARARSWGGKTLARIDRVAGITNAAPKPIRARVAMTWLGLLERVASSEADPNTTRPN